MTDDVKQEIAVKHNCLEAQQCPGIVTVMTSCGLSLADEKRGSEMTLHSVLFQKARGVMKQMTSRAARARPVVTTRQVITCHVAISNVPQSYYRESC
ncbi:hypothetical protein BaRGS_00034863 [Batillaria attramentaria]|uniref:Uncharacterized protein n=1 Tax=Batillaria attramentaria TaxID=370345 RepID=A0ABD0JFS9_9CAEN